MLWYSIPTGKHEVLLLSHYRGMDVTFSFIPIASVTSSMPRTPQMLTSKPDLSSELQTSISPTTSLRDGPKLSMPQTRFLLIPSNHIVFQCSIFLSEYHQPEEQARTEGAFLGTSLSLFLLLSILLKDCWNLAASFHLGHLPPAKSILLIGSSFMWVL